MAKKGSPFAYRIASFLSHLSSMERLLLDPMRPCVLLLDRDGSRWRKDGSKRIDISCSMERRQSRDVEATIPSELRFRFSSTNDRIWCVKLAIGD